MQNRLLVTLLLLGSLVLAAIPFAARAQSYASWGASGSGMDCSSESFSGVLADACGGPGGGVTTVLTAGPGGVLHGNLTGTSASGGHGLVGKALLGWNDTADILCAYSSALLCGGVSFYARVEFSVNLSAYAGQTQHCGGECDTYASVGAKFSFGGDLFGESVPFEGDAYSEDGVSYSAHHTASLTVTLPLAGYLHAVHGFGYGMELEGGVAMYGDEPGSFNANASHTMYLASFGILDASGNDVTSAYDITWEHGTVAGGVAPIPEPETYAMLLAGLGLLGWQARRRKMKPAA